MEKFWFFVIFLFSLVLHLNAIDEGSVHDKLYLVEVDLQAGQGTDVDESIAVMEGWILKLTVKYMGAK